MNNGENNPSRGKKVLIVEDSRTQAMVLQDFLEKQGFLVSVSYDGVQALAHMKDTIPHIIISDIVMPHMDGYELSRAIKSDEALKHIPVILLTSLSDPEDVLKALECRADNFITKVEAENILLSRMTQLLSQKKEDRELSSIKSSEIYFGGKKYLIDMENQRTLDFLLSTYETAVMKNHDLQAARIELIELNEHLEEKVIELKHSQERITQQNLELNEVNEKLSMSEESLRLANTMKDKFLSILAHDLRNPVSSFYQIIDLMLSSQYTLDENTKSSLLKDLHNAASHLRELLENLLTWARSQTRGIDFSPSMHLLAPVAMEVASHLSPGGQQKNITIQTDIADHLSAYFDKNMVSTILRNLVSNATKFTPEGGTITISAGKQGNFLAVSVADTGIGMTVQDLRLLFRIDVHPSKIGTGKEKGTGLGLILCKEFAERHGGTIMAMSELKKGSTFTFTLPGNPSLGSKILEVEITS